MFAGVPGGGTSGWCRREKELTPMWTHRLWTYYWIVKDKGKMEKPNTVNLFLDSGAFSAWTRDENIDVKVYIAFIKKNKKYIDHYSNLDILCSVRTNLASARKKAAEATLSNQRKMEKAGLDPIPVFHYGEPFEYLSYYIEKYKYISIGGLVGVPTGLAMEFLDLCFSKYICDERGLPRVKIHGFDMTSLRVMLRYPWYSVDSTSWVVTGRMGGIYVPVFKKGKWVYDETSHKIAVSSKSPTNKEKGKHIETMSPAQKQQVLDYIHDKGYVLGKSSFRTVPNNYELKENETWAEKKNGSTDPRKIEIIEEPGISNKYTLRDELNIIYFNDLQKNMRSWPWKFNINKTPNLF